MIEIFVDAKHWNEKLDFYHKIFDSSSNNISIVRKWLIKNKVSPVDLDDVESDMVILFVRSAMSHSYDKVPFEQFVWTKFKNALLDYYRANNRKRRKGLLPLDDFVFPVISIHDIKIDYDAILNEMGETSAFIFDKLFVMGWRRQEIQNHLNIAPSIFDREVSNIRRVVKKYSECKL